MSRAAEVNTNYTRLIEPAFNHLFDHPLCKEQSLTHRVLNVVFHILTLGIPLAFYKIIACIFPREKPIYNDQDCICSVLMPALNSVQAEKQRKVALDFARDQLKQRPNLKPVVFTCDSEPVLQPVNQEISRLVALTNELNRDFRLKFDTKNKPYENQDVISDITRLMHLYYAIAILSLQDLPAFTNQNNLPIHEALCCKSTYLELTFFHLPKFYHKIRGEVSYTPDPNPADGGTFAYNEPISKEHEKRFYLEHSVENQWRLLYNDYCQYVRASISKADLEHPHLARQLHWTEQDLGPKTFSRVPGTLPNVQSWAY